MNAVSDEIDNPNFLDTGDCVDWYSRLLIITERGIGHFDGQKRLGGGRMACDNISIVKNRVFKDPKLGEHVSLSGADAK